MHESGKNLAALDMVTHPVVDPIDKKEQNR